MNATQTFLNVTPTASGLLEMRHGGVSQVPTTANYTKNAPLRVRESESVYKIPNVYFTPLDFLFFSAWHVALNSADRLYSSYLPSPIHRVDHTSPFRSNVERT